MWSLTPLSSELCGGSISQASLWLTPFVAMLLLLASLESSSLVNELRDGHEPHGSKSPSSIATALLAGCRLSPWR